MDYTFLVKIDATIRIHCGKNLLVGGRKVDGRNGEELR